MANETKKPAGGKKNKQAAKKNSFWKGLKTEYRKIIWPDRKKLGKQTVAVVSISAIICAMITIIDNLGLQIMELIIK